MAKPVQRPPLKTSKKAIEPNHLTLFDRLEFFFEKKESLLFWLIFGITAIVSILLYDPRISLAGDDSSYILGANNLIKHFAYPGYQGPLFPIVLSPLVALFGITLFPLKLVSLVSMLAFIYISFITFRKKIPSLLLLSSLFLVSINSFVLYYASQTFSEAFYMFIQSLVLWVLFRYFIEDESKEEKLIDSLKHHALLAVTLVAASSTRSVGFALLIGVCGYFLFYRRWKDLGFSILAFIAVYAIYTGILHLLWGDTGFQASSQGASLLQKDFYHPEYGNEDLKGLLARFWQNSLQYLSNGLIRIMGFTKEVGDNSAFETLLIYAIAFGTMIATYKKNRGVFAICMLAGATLLTTFIALQSFWNQDRLMIPVYFYLLIIILGFLYYLLTLDKFKSLQFLFFIPVFILFIHGLGITSDAVKTARKIKTEYDGLNPDWRNYMKASHWAGLSLAKDNLVACRKPSISTIYGKGKDFFGIYTVPPTAAESLLKEWSAEPTKYIGVPISEENFKFYGELYQDYRARLESTRGIFWILNNSDHLRQIVTHYAIPAVQWKEIDNLSRQKDANITLYCADSLLTQFRQGKVSHILTANLRLNPEQKTGQIISTVERYAYYIQEKYPTIFELVHQEGNDNDEPARIFKINWQVAGSQSGKKE